MLIDALGRRAEEFFDNPGLVKLWNEATSKLPVWELVEAVSRACEKPGRYWNNPLALVIDKAEEIEAEGLRKKLEIETEQHPTLPRKKADKHFNEWKGMLIGVEDVKARPGATKEDAGKWLDAQLEYKRTGESPPYHKPRPCYLCRKQLEDPAAMEEHHTTHFPSGVQQRLRGMP